MAAQHGSKLATCMVAACLSGPASAQFWEDAGQGMFLGNAWICMNDTVNDVLYAGGGDWFNTDTASYWPLYRYDGTHWDTLGLFGNELKTAVMYHDTLIVGGAFKSILDEPIKRIACFAGGTWQSYGDINSGIEGAYVQSLRVIDGEMYATGPFTHADGYYCNGLAKRVGGHWENVGPVPEYVGTPIMKDIAKYQGKLVVSGIFDFADNSIRNLMQLVDTAWEPLCSYCLQGGFDSGGQMAVYKDELYIGGRSHYSSGNPGQGGLRWDGEQAYSIGEPGQGVQTIYNSDAYAPKIERLVVHDSLLLVVGGFRFASLMGTPGVAVWDGSTYCVPGGGDISPITGAANAVFYHDTLYISAGFGNGFMRYLGDDIRYQCSTLGIDGNSPAKEVFRTAWSSSGVLNLLNLSDGPHQLRVYDPQGRLVLEREVRSAAGRSASIPFTEHSMAVYIAVVDGHLADRFIPVR